MGAHKKGQHCCPTQGYYMHGVITRLCCGRCGPARHSIQAVQRGASRAIGVDNSAAMLGHARHLAAEAGVAAELVQGTLGSVSKTLQLGMHLVLKKLYDDQFEIVSASRGFTAT